VPKGAACYEVKSSANRLDERYLLFAALQKIELHGEFAPHVHMRSYTKDSLCQAPQSEIEKGMGMQSKDSS
jgi:hypothetical protein